MLTKNPWHILQRPNHQRACAENHHKAYGTVRRSPGNCKTAETEMVWARDKIGGLTKMILQGTVEGPRIRGMPKKRWIDNIAERTGKSFAETSCHGTHRQEWRELTEKSIMTRGAMGPMQKAGRSVEYVVWCALISISVEHCHTTSIIKKIKQLNIRKIIIVKHANSRWIILRMPTLTACCLALCCSLPNTPVLFGQ